jgi:hypothetical protein
VESLHPIIDVLLNLLGILVVMMDHIIVIAEVRNQRRQRAYVEKPKAKEFVR